MPVLRFLPWRYRLDDSLDADSLDADSLDADSPDADSPDADSSDVLGVLAESVEQIIRSMPMALLAARIEAPRAPNCELSVSMVTKDSMAALNCAWRGEPKATDVLSFPGTTRAERTHTRDKDSPPLLLGDIVLCPEWIEAQARELGLSLRDHGAHLVVHGVLHLLGWTHDSAGRRRRMIEAEHAILTHCGFTHAPEFVATNYRAFDEGYQASDEGFSDCRRSDNRHHREVG